MDAPPLPKKKQAVFHHPLGFELYDGLAMDMHAMTYAEPLLKEIEKLRDSEKFYRRRCEALQEWQSKMRDPERTIVCDILANGATLHPDYSGDRYKVTPNTWPNGTRHALEPSEHERWNARNYPGTRQLCAYCDEPTGRCEDDSIFTDDGDGPLCEGCGRSDMPANA